VAEMSDPIRVVVVDDDALVRAALSMVLASAEDIAIVGEATDGNEVAHAVSEHEPGIVLMDIRMPGMDGLAATELLRAQDGAPEVIVLTTFDVDEYVLRALRAGASGFLLKDTPPADIVRAVRAVAAGEPMLSPTITRRLIGHVTDSEGGDRRQRARERLDRLTEREREVAVAIGLGKSNAEIGRELYMSVATVKAHVSRVLEKLEFNNRVQIALLVTTPARRDASGRSCPSSVNRSAARCAQILDRNQGAPVAERRGPRPLGGKGQCAGSSKPSARRWRSRRSSAPRRRRRARPGNRHRRSTRWASVAASDQAQASRRRAGIRRPAMPPAASSTATAGPALSTAWTA
jgi:DNA-binding NarL/FixJ family response regulator